MNIPGVFTVGASDRNDQQSDYSPTINAGSNNNQFIDVTAPSHRAYPPSAYPNGDGGVAGETFEVWSIDIPNSSGYNPWPAGSTVQPPFIGERLPSSGVNFLSYTGRFGGTSAACPQIAGIAALVLSVNPNFTQQQVFDAITGSADKVGGYAYSNGQSNELGYGRANACRAVLQSLSIAGANQFCSGTSSYSVANSPANFSYTWSSSNTNIATIDAASGVATGVGNGLVTFTATTSSGCSTSVSKTVQVG